MIIIAGSRVALFQLKMTEFPSLMYLHFEDMWTEDGKIILRSPPASLKTGISVLCFSGYRGAFGDGGSAGQENKAVVMKSEDSGPQNWSLFVTCRQWETIPSHQVIFICS